MKREALMAWLRQTACGGSNFNAKLHAAADMLAADAQQPTDMNRYTQATLAGHANGLAEGLAMAADGTQQVAVPQEPNNDEVICPQCCAQFRAIPANVQGLMLAAGFEPPFKAAPQPPQGE